MSVLAWPNFAAAKEIAGDPSLSPADVLRSPKLREFVQAKFGEHNRTSGGSSGRVKRVMLMLEPPSIDANEITDKGYVNQRAALDRRRRLVDLLYAATPHEDVIEIA